jgi:FKBP-type peptidyl-prolyl cis-trans isomerase
VRRIAALLAVPLLIVSAAACGSDDHGKSSKSGGIPAVTGAPEKKPKVAKGQGTPPKALKVKVLKQGTGPALKKGDLLQADYLGQTWNGKVFDNSYDRGQPATFQVGAGKVIKGWDEGLVGKRMGSRVELIIPPDKGYGNQPQQNIPANSTLAFVVDMKNSYPSEPSGKKVPQTNAALPKVDTTTGATAPKVTLPKGKDAPKAITSATIIEGSGKTIAAKDTVLANYEAVLWKGAKPGGDTWTQGGPQPVPIAKLPGWQDGLKGKKVGSRVLIVVPKTKLPKDQQKQVGTDVVFVVDVLAIQ